MTTNFADISHHNATVDLAAYKAAGHTRIVLKATEGIGFTDPLFAERWRLAGQLGLLRTAYHYSQAENNGAAEFDYFIGVVNAAGGLKPGDELCVDVEDVDDGAADYARADENVREFTYRAAVRGYATGWLYTGRWYAEPANVQANDAAPGWRRLWISDYHAIPDSAVQLPAGWAPNQVFARQFTSTSSVPGIAGQCDYSRLWFPTTAPTTEDDFMALFNTLDDFKAALRAVLNEGTGQGQLTWAGTEKAELGTDQANANRLNTLTAKVDALSAKLDQLAAASTAGVDVTALAATVAKAAADEVSKRMAA